MSMGTRVLGVMDLVAALIILLFIWGVLPWRMVLSAAIYLGGKGFAFFGDLFSIIDLVSAVILLFAGIYNPVLLTYAVVVWLVLKGFMSLF